MQLILLSTFIIGTLAQGCPKEGRAYYPDSQQCDKYVQCLDGEASDQLCPDGLLFKEFGDDRHPCVYPVEVDCGSRTKRQPARPTQHCPHQWAHASSGDSGDCALFYTCVDGKEFSYLCPEGLAFSSLTYTCEWADQSPDCDAQAYLGFSCPKIEPNQIRLAGSPRYASPRDCKKFFLCAGQSPRLQTCEEGLVFNQETNACDEPEAVRGCETYYPADELKEIRAARERRFKIEAEREARIQARREKILKDRQG